ncbi:glycosyltransferase family 4 protein [Bacillus cytotoxicus]|uniref:Glycosyltransferase family 4 protein n=1 Tax=Bacillus cytotoxicus TaxID=580165 RepID=A0ACC6A2D4_9BACI|nr:glycosyltransferase family 4 protein [Bacillus cytotoxicus]
MSKRVLFCATVDYHFKAFHLPFMKWFTEQGWEVHVAASGNIQLPYVNKKYDIPIQRSPFKLQNYHAYKKLASIIDKNKYSIIHCHTPMGGVIARLAAKTARREGTKVIYTAHGFHFCKGAPLINWFVYYPIEKMLAHYTDCLITINKEDYNRAVKHRFQAGSIEHIHGIGVDTEQFRPITETHKQSLKEQSGYKSDDFLMLYAAEFNKNKNQQLLIQSLSLLKNEVPNAKLLLAGNGPLMEDCKNLAFRLGVTEMVHFLGYRNDISSLLPMCDLAVASSLREGLPVNIMEAMACALPVVATDNRGHRELILNNENGWIVSHDNIVEMSNKIKHFIQNPNLSVQFGSTGRKMIENKYAIHEVLDETKDIYAMFMGETEELKWAVH